jgi:hypothetical protein
MHGSQILLVSSSTFVVVEYVLLPRMTSAPIAAGSAAGVRDGKSLRLGERNNAVIVSLRRTVLLKKLLRSEVLTIVRTGRITLFL